MAALGAGAGAHEGDRERAQLALQARAQNVQMRGQDMQRQMHMDDARRRAAAQQAQMAQQQRQFDAQLEQRTAERTAAEGRDTRDFNENQRRFGIGEARSQRMEERQQREDAFGDMLKTQQLADMQLRHQTAQAQYGEMMAEVNKAKEQRENMARLAKSGVGMLMRSAYESVDGRADPAAVEYVQKLLGDDNITGLGFDPDSGNFVMTMKRIGPDGKPVLHADGKTIVEDVKPFMADKANAILGDVYGKDFLNVRNTAAKMQSAQDALAARQTAQTDKAHLGMLGRRVETAEKLLFKAESEGDKDAVQKAQAYYDKAWNEYEGYRTGGGGAGEVAKPGSSDYQIDEKTGSVTRGGFTVRKGQVVYEDGVPFVWNGKQFVQKNRQ